MTRYIDADKIKYTTDTHTVTDLKIAFKHEIDAIPTADVREVIRCKDCKYWNKEDGEYCEELSREIGWSEDEYYRVYTDKNDFCSYGAKMDEEAN